MQELTAAMEQLIESQKAEGFNTQQGSEHLRAAEDHVRRAKEHFAAAKAIEAELERVTRVNREVRGVLGMNKPMWPLVLSASQLGYLLNPAQYGAEGYVDDEEEFEPGTIAITDYNDEGWIFVESTENVGTEGSGVWVDRKGREHQGPAGDAVQTTQYEGQQD